MILERKETNKVKPMTDPAYYLEWFQAMAQKEFRQSPAVSQLRRELGIRKSPHIQGSQGRVSERRELHGERTLRSTQSPLVFSGIEMSACVIENHPKPGKQYHKSFRENNPKFTKGEEQLLFPPVKVRNPTLCTSVTGPRRVLPNSKAKLAQG